MMWHTHAALGAASVWLLTPFLPADPRATAVVTVFAVTGAMVPDLDAVESKLKHVKLIGIKLLMPMSRAINHEFGHRGLVHSLWGWLIWTALIAPLVLRLGIMPIVALSLGYISHLAGDACTRTGIPLLYPSKKQFNLLPPKMRVVTGSDYEELFFVTFGLLSLIQLLTHLWN